MSRTSCIAHSPKQAMAIIRQDYYALTGNDACAAALLNLFEYWANAALASDPAVERPWVGARPIREFEQMLLGIATDKQIRKRLVRLEACGFIQVQGPSRRGEAKQYRVMVPEIQQALTGQITDGSWPREISGARTVGQITEENSSLRLNDLSPVGQMTQASSVKLPMARRSNDRALKKSSKEFKKEHSQEEISFIQEKPMSPSESAIQIGTVTYAQPPESIDLSELWDTHPGLAKRQLRQLAPGHKRLEMVAQGFGHWWVGPGLNDFDECLIQACQKRKRLFQQPDGVGDAKTYLNNMLRNGDWGNFALRCEEARDLKRRKGNRLETQPAESQTLRHSPFVRTLQERRESALGLARFKLQQGQVAAAEAISRQFGFAISDLAPAVAATALAGAA